MTLFEAVVAMGTNCLFTFNNEDERYVYSIDNNKPMANKYGETVVLSRQSILQVADRYLSLIVSPLPDSKGSANYHLSFIRDFRSMGKSVSTNLANMIVSADKPKTQMTSGVSVEGKKCLVGLKLVPAQTAK